MKLILALLMCGLLVACGPDDGYHNFYLNITSYSINVTHITPLGIKIDAGKTNPNLDDIDNRILKIEDCLLNGMRERPLITNEEMKKWWCSNNIFDPEIKLKRKYFILKLVKPFLSNTSGWLFIGENEKSTTPLQAPNYSCEAKNIKPPCYWRTAIQDENIIISPNPILDNRLHIEPTTPQAPYLWELGRMMTGCNLVWYAPHFAKCLSY